MIEFIKKNILIIIAVLIIASISVYYFIRDYRASKTEYYDSIARGYVYEPIPRVYNVNEYVNINISTISMIETYYNNYINLIRSDINEAYSKLDDEYGKTKFPTIDSFKNYIVSNNIGESKIFKYNITSSKKGTLYIVYDEKYNVYVFVVNGVLQYTVYFGE